MQNSLDAEAALLDAETLSNLMECLFGTHQSTTTLAVPLYYRTDCIIDHHQFVTMNILTHINVKIKAPKSSIKPFLLYKPCKNKKDFKLIWTPAHWIDNTPPVFCTKRDIQNQLHTKHIECGLKHIACSVEHDVF